jgi:hypothetical protein
LWIGLREWKCHVDAIDASGRHVVVCWFWLEKVNFDFSTKRTERKKEFSLKGQMSDADARRREQRKRELEEKRAQAAAVQRPKHKTRLNANQSNFTHVYSKFYYLYFEISSG